MTASGITGSTGLIGREIIKNKLGKFKKFTGDLKKKNDVYKWIKENKFDTFFHLASLVSVKDANKNYLKAKNINFIGTKHIIDAIIKFNPKLKWFFFTSSAHVYEIPRKNKLITENSKIKPFSKYGKTKLLAERYIIKKLSQKKIPYCIVRIFNIADKKQSKTFFYQSTIKKIKKSKSKKVKFENIDHYRDFINLKYLIKIIKKIYTKKITGIYNLGSGKKTHLINLVDLLCKKYTKKLDLINNNHTTYLVANISKLKKELSLSKNDFDILKNL